MKRRIIPIYNLSAHFTNDEADCREFLKKHGGDEKLTDDCKGCVINFRGDSDEGYLIMAVYDGDPGTVAHEALHAAWDILDACSIRVDNENDEALAFLVGWFAKTMHDLFPFEPKDKPKTPAPIKREDAA
jgi:hypothetical protein